MNSRELQNFTIELVKATAAFDEAKRLAATQELKVKSITEKISKANQYAKEPDAFVNCGDLGLYHLKFHKETGALVATHVVKTAVLDLPQAAPTAKV